MQTLDEFLSRLCASGARDVQQELTHGSDGEGEGEVGDEKERQIRVCLQKLDTRMRVLQLRLVWPLARPFVMALMPVGLAATASWFGRYLLRTLCADAVVGPELALVPFLALALLAKGEQQYTAGTFVRKTGAQGGRMTKILERADLLRPDVYAAPPWYFGGDVATIWSAAMTSWPGAPPPRRCVGIRGDRMLQCSVCRLRALRGDARPWHSLEVVTDDTSSGCTCLYRATGTSCSIFSAPTSSSPRQRCAMVTLLLLRGSLCWRSSSSVRRQHAVANPLNMMLLRHCSQ